jgi:hypothetical protein
MWGWVWRVRNRRDITLLAVELTVVAALLYAFWPGWPRLEADDVVTLVVFLVAIYVLELFDVELPQGDYTSMAAPVVAVAVPFVASENYFWLIVLPTVLAQLSRVRSKSATEPLDAVLRRGILAIVAGVMWAFAGGSGLDVSSIAGSLVFVGLVVLADFVLAEIQTAIRTGSSLLSLMVGGLGLQGSLVAANASAGALALLIYPVMGVWAVLALVLVLLLMRQSFSMLLSVRRAYQSTIEALVRTVEAQRPGKLGHSERVAALATEAGRVCGFRGHELERLSYAGLLHDLGGGDVEGEPEVGGAPIPEASSAADMIEEVTFLSEVTPILRLQDEHVSPEKDSKDIDLQMAYLVLAASGLDDSLRGHSDDADAEKLAHVAQRLESEQRSRLDRAIQSAMSRIAYGRATSISAAAFGG